MDNSAYVMASKQMSAVKNLEVIANNVSNVNTAGFKMDNMIFKQYLHKDVYDKTSMTAPKDTITNFDEGSLKTTERPFDVAIAGTGMFIIRTPAGERYTRAGHLKINQNGLLVNGQGYPILSFDREEIIFEEGDIDPIIGSDGTVFVGDAERGQIGVAEFENINNLRKLGNGLFISSVEPQLATNSKVMQGVLEESNVNTISQIAYLAQIEKEVSQTSHFINEVYALQRNAFKIYSKMGG